MMQLQEQRTDHIIEAWAKAAAGHNPGASLGGIEEQLSPRASELEQDLRLGRTVGASHHLCRYSCQVVDGTPKRRVKSRFSETSNFHGVQVAQGPELRQRRRPVLSALLEADPGAPPQKPLDNMGEPFQILRMVATNSTMLPLGTEAPDFHLSDPSEKMFHLSDFQKAAGLVVVFMCNHCPYVKHLRAGLAQLARDFNPLGIAVVGINSNDVTNYPADSPANMAQEAKAAGYSFPYLYDATQAVAKAYRAACTPDFYLFDRDRRLVYRGQFDDSRPGNTIPVTGKDLRAAIEALLAGKQIAPVQVASLGCNIKWKPGNEPTYFG
jgi:peroxiredoxin